jgi:hypothetical protein
MQSHNTLIAAQEGSMCSSYSFTTSALDGVSGQRHAPAALYPLYPLYRRLSGPQSRSGHRGLLLPSGSMLNRPVVLSVARHYTDWIPIFKNAFLFKRVTKQHIKIKISLSNVVIIITIIFFFFSGSTVLVRTLAASHRRFRNLITTNVSTPLEEWSSRRKGLYQHRATQKHRQTSMLRARFESTIPVTKRPRPTP